MSGKETGGMLLGAALLGALAVGVVLDRDNREVAIYDGTSLQEMPARLKTAPIIDPKTLEVITPAGPRHTFGRGGDCARGSRYCSVIYDASTDRLDLSHCYAVVQLVDAEGDPYTECQVTADAWLQMNTPTEDWHGQAF